MKTSLFNIVVFTVFIAYGSAFSQSALAVAGKVCSASEAAPEKSRFDVEKSRKISRVFKVGANDKLDIENKFGKVHVNTWDKNEIAVEVTMLARANNDENAQKLLDKMDVKIAQSGEVIAFKTELESSNNQGKQRFEINYTVSMPKGNPLRIKNSFGDAYLADYTGTADLNVGYGSLKTAHLSGNGNTVKVSFGSGNLSSLRGGTLDVSYSHLKLGSSETLDLKSDFSDVEIERVKDLTIRSKYGSVKLGLVNSVEGHSSFSDFVIKELGSKLDMKVQYCGDFEIAKIAKAFRSVSIAGQFSSFDLRFEPNASFAIDVAMAFGHFRLADDLQEEAPQYSLMEKKNTSSHHIGKVGKSATGQVTIKAQYGDVKMNKAN